MSTGIDFLLTVITLSRCCSVFLSLACFASLSRYRCVEPSSRTASWVPLSSSNLS